MFSASDLEIYFNGGIKKPSGEKYHPTQCGEISRLLSAWCNSHSVQPLMKLLTPKSRHAPAVSPDQSGETGCM